MKKNVQLCFVFIGNILLYSCCFALNSEIYPWYFQTNQIKECWEMGYAGQGVVVDVLDTEIKFISILEGKEYFSADYSISGKHFSDDAEKIHDPRHLHID